jgi:hypothetical protein
MLQEKRSNLKMMEQFSYLRFYSHILHNHTRLICLVLMSNQMKMKQLQFLKSALKILKLFMLLGKEDLLRFEQKNHITDFRFSKLKKKTQAKFLP